MTNQFHYSIHFIGDPPGREIVKLVSFLDGLGNGISHKTLLPLLGYHGNGILPSPTLFPPTSGTQIHIRMDST